MNFIESIKTRKGDFITVYIKNASVAISGSLTGIGEDYIVIDDGVSYPAVIPFERISTYIMGWKDRYNK